MPVHKSVSRRREKKVRLRRDTRAGLSRGNQRDPAILTKPCDPAVQKGIAPSQKEGALTPRFPCRVIALCGHRGVTNGTPRSALCLFSRERSGKKGIAPSRKEGALTPRCPCTKAYRAVAKRRGAYAAMPVLGSSRGNQRDPAILTKPCDPAVQKGIAPSRKEGALTPRCPCTKAYRAVAKRKGAYAAMPARGKRCND